MKNKQAYRDIRLRCDEAQEIMGQVPPAILRWGITVLFAIVVAAVVVGSFVKYPERLSLSASLTNADRLAEGERMAHFRAAVGQEELHLLQERMPVIIHYGRYTCNGRLYNIHQDYDKHTGLYNIDLSCEAVPIHVPVLIQYRESVTVTVDVSHETVVQKVFGGRLRMDEK